MSATSGLLLLMALTRPLAAQGPGPVGLKNRASVATSHQTTSRALLPRDSIPSNHWQRGAIIGGVIGFAGGLFLWEGLKDIGDTGSLPATPIIGLFTTIGAFIGAMIGSFSHR